MKRVIGATVGLGMLIPVASFAQTTTPSVTALLEQIKALQTQIAALQAQQASATVTLLQTLKQGSSGDDVKILQALLAADPDIYPDGIISGYFGPKTAAAVAKFQRKNGLESVGHVGPKTLQKLNEALMQTPVALQSGTTTGSMPCAIVPPGHLIAPGWLKKNGNQAPVVPPCQTLPPGIAKKITGTSTIPVPPATTTPDTIAPVISGVSLSAVASTSATISWNTNELATGKIYFGTTTPVNMSTASSQSNTSLTFAHSFMLTNLATSTTYYFMVESRDAANNTATSSILNLITTSM